MCHQPLPPSMPIHMCSAPGGWEGRLPHVPRCLACLAPSLWFLEVGLKLRSCA